MSSNQELIEKYAVTIMEYLAMMQASEAVRSADDAKYLVQTGLTTITHVFKLAYCGTKNAITSAGHCQKGAYCYIEYVEQMQKLNASATNQQMDYVDAITFIYDKTLSELCGVDQGSSAFTNILSMHPSNQANAADFEKGRLALEQADRATACLIWFQHPDFTLIDQLDIAEVSLIPLLTLLSECKFAHEILLFLETVQEVVILNRIEYSEVLTSLLKHGKKQSKNDKFDRSVILQACLYLKTYSPGTPLDKIAVQEKWKRPTDDIIRLGFI